MLYLKREYFEIKIKIPLLGNYYSLRADHQKAVMYFHRALKMNPQYLSAWTLLGHEFMEMKSTNGAIHSYRQAIGKILEHFLLASIIYIVLFIYIC